jgi:hypothetical protein
MLDDLMAWDSDFHGNVQIKNIEQVTHCPTLTAEHNFVGSLDSMSFLYHHAPSAAKNPSPETHDVRVEPADDALGAKYRFNVFAAAAIPKYYDS